MTDPTDDDTLPPLVPANRNPWYVLATLYGEQDDTEINFDLHDSNRSVWNAWSCQNLSQAAQEATAVSSGVPIEEVAAWGSISDTVAQRHESEWLKRNDKRFPYPGLPNVSERVDLGLVTFPKSLMMARCIFTRETKFSGSTFQREVRFDDSIFSEDLLLDEATFCWDAKFRGVQLRGVAYFGNATFLGVAWFGSARFGGNANFHNVTFNEFARFFEVTFCEDARFTGVEFRMDASFSRVTFGGDAMFKEATYSKGSDFQRATFNRQANFTSSTFGADGGEQFVTFADCQFDKPLNFRGAKFLAQYPVFSGAITADRNIFTAKRDHWPNKTTQDPEEARESCAAIRHMLDKQGLPDEAHFFYRREMGFAGQIGWYWQRLPYRLYGALSDYGHSIRLPVEWLAALIVTGWVIFSFWLALCQPAGAATRWHQPLVEGLSLSIANTLPFLGLMRSMHPHFYERAPALIDFLSIAQSLAGIILLFLLGLGLRTRFRMR
jgi:uncharacterized protein YjbI with pentapeptide repeats